MNFTGISSFSCIFLMPGPPPWERTGLRPKSFSRTTSWRTAFFSSSLIMALPPYLMTTIFPAYFCR